MHTPLFLFAALVLAAAPGEPAPTIDQMPARIDAALTRRLGDTVAKVKIETIKPSEVLPGYVACGKVSERGAGTDVEERFFIVVPGNFAVLDRDGRSLLDAYWHRYGC